MSEFFFPVVGTIVVFFIGVPLLTLVARGISAVLPPTRDAVLAQASPWRFILIVSPSLGPVIWLASAAVHQAEQGASLTACISGHSRGDACRDVGLFALLLLSVLAAAAVSRLKHGRPPERTSRYTMAAVARVRRICETNLTLVPGASRVRVVARGLAPACARGLFRSRVELEAELVHRLSDEELEATLLHEFEHAQARDPLHLFIAQAALSINPFGYLLAAELSRYHFAREALCDRRAVQLGADPLALARSIVSVATPRSPPDFAAALGGHGIEGVRVRVQLLLGYATHSPEPVGRGTPPGLLTAVLMIVTASPHFIGTGPLDVLHRGVESTALTLGLG